MCPAINHFMESRKYLLCLFTYVIFIQNILEKKKKKMCFFKLSSEPFLAIVFIRQSKLIWNIIYKQDNEAWLDDMIKWINFRKVLPKCIS